MPTGDKLGKLLDAYGYTNDEDGKMAFLEDYAHDSVVPGICMTAGCDYTTEMEPDQDRGWCEVCKEGRVKSGLILAGVM